MATAQLYTDHLGNTFESKIAMYKHYGITKRAFLYRLKHNWSLERILTTPLFAQTTYTDHLGNVFPTIDAMCEHWNITRKVHDDRKKQNWSLKRILTTPVRQMITPCKDHLGNTFSSIAEMCNYWNITVGTYGNRMNKLHWSLKQTLTTPMKEYKDPYGNSFDNSQEMCKAYHMQHNTFRGNIQDKKSLIEALRIIPLLNRNLKNYTFDNHLTIIELVKISPKTSPTQKYFVCLFDDHEVILPYKWIIQYCEQHLPPEKNPMRQC